MRIVDSFSLVEICGISNPLLLPWLDLYETAFPPAERVLVSRILKLIEDQEHGFDLDRHILAAVDARGELAGLVFDYEPETIPAAFLWYIAVAPRLRGQGLGGALYQAMLRRFSQDVKAMIFDLEDPRQAASEEERQSAIRRIAFYRRHGARLLGGIDYVQNVGPHQPSIRLRVMVHPLLPITPSEAFNLAKTVLGDAIRPVDKLYWDES